MRFDIIKKLVRIVIPRAIREKARHWFEEKRRSFKAPRMIWGYRDASGRSRSRTRISDTVFFNRPERISIGDNVFVGHYCILDGTGFLDIHEGVQIAGWNGLYTHSSHIAIRLYGRHYQEVAEELKEGYQVGKVAIGRYSFIGAGALILPGVNIGRGALVAAGSIVKDHVLDFQIVAGNPAQPIGDTRKLDARFLNDAQLRMWYEEWQKN